MYELLPYAGLGSLGRINRDFDGIFSRFLHGAELPIGTSDERSIPKMEFSL